MGAAKISYLALALYFLILIIPVAIFIYLKIKKVRPLITAVIRMVVQLTFVALYLEYIFKWNHPLINVLWVLIIIGVANTSILKQSGLKFKIFFIHTASATILSVVFIFSTMLFLFDVKTFYSSQYLIPIAGMILGNILRSNIITLDRFYSSLKKRTDEYIYYVTLGATRLEALQPFMAEALSASASPHIATIATMGLVSLPGMMTGQILGGADPTVAIQYQIMIMIAIFTTAVLSTFLALLFTTIPSIDRFGRVRGDIFTA
jgi:putative ABC transport system permease protein